MVLRAEACEKKWKAHDEMCVCVCVCITNQLALPKWWSDGL